MLSIGSNRRRSRRLDQNDRNVAGEPRGDVESVVALFDPAIEWREAESNPYQPDGAPWVGADAIVQNLFVRLGTERMASRFRRHLYGAGDTVVAECRYTGTYQSMGRSLDAQACHVWKLRDGKIVSFQQYADTAQLQDVMGTREAAQPATAPASA